MKITHAIAAPNNFRIIFTKNKPHLFCDIFRVQNSIAIYAFIIGIMHFKFVAAFRAFILILESSHEIESCSDEFLGVYA